MYQFDSYKMHINDLVDCRRLTLSLCFYQLDQERVIDLSERFFQWMYDRTGTDFIYECFCDGKYINIKKMVGQIAEKFDPAKGLDIGIDADAVSPIVYNLTTLRKVHRFVCYENPEMLWGKLSFDMGLDYPPFADRIFTKWRPNFEEIPAMAYQFFREPNRKLIAHSGDKDLYFSFDAIPYEKDPGQYYGSARISFGAVCLGARMESMANEMAQFSVLLAEKFTNLGAHVTLQPGYKSTYLHYFGSDLIHDGSHEDVGCSVKEWYPTYYVCDIAWMNILSPLSKQHIMPIPGDIEGVVVKDLSCGGRVVQSPKTITQYDVADAYAIKKVLLPALYPGRSSRRSIRHWYDHENKSKVYSFCPRSQWEIVPIDENEIKVYGTEMIYAAQSIFL